MFSNDYKQFMTAAKLVIGVFTVCALIYLGFRYIHVVAAAILWFIRLISPILLGLIFALTLNIPLHFFENRLFSEKVSKKLRRNISIFLSLLLVFGIIVLLLFLVVPELIEAVSTFINIGTGWVGLLSALENSLKLSSLPFGQYLSNITIDWNAIALWLEDLLPAFPEDYTEKLPGMLSSSFRIMFDIFIGIIFSVYILAQKETLKAQTFHFLSIWIPKKWNDTLFHIAYVCTDSFRNFIAGQTTEAVILGTLCTLGMFLLRLPFAPTIGVLVGVTAFIPYVGAYLGALAGTVLLLTISPLKAVIFLAFLLVLQQVEGNIIYPRVVGSRIHLPSLWVLFALTIGGRLAGPVGMIFGVPAFAAIYRLLKEATERKKIPARK